MSLRLVREDLHRLSTAQEALLSIPVVGSVSTWCQRTVAAVGDLLRSDRVVTVVPHFDGVEMACSPEMLPFMEPVRRAFHGVGIGRNHYRVPQVEASQVLRRRKGFEIWTNRMLVDLHGVPMEDAGWYYHEFVARAGVADGGGIAVRLPIGEALLLATPGHPGPNPFGDDWLEVAGLILPAFKAAVRHLQQEQLRGAQLVNAMDRLAGAMWLWSREGVELHRNPALERLLVDQGVEEELRAEAADLVRACGLFRGNTKSEPTLAELPAGERVVTSGQGGRIRMRAVFLGSQLQGPAELVLVEVECPGPILPQATALQARWGLTHRQAEVALLLARGASNRDVARALSISLHTVRSHAEVVFQKLGIHSRKALGLRLISRDEALRPLP